MAKSPIKLVSKPGDPDAATYEFALSNDKRTFVLRLESTKPMSFFDVAVAVRSWARDEIRRITSAKGGRQ
jgi:hypothetical protein